MANPLRIPTQPMVAPTMLDVESPERTLAYLNRLHASTERNVGLLRRQLDDFFTGTRTVLSGGVEFGYKHITADYTTVAEVIIGVDTSSTPITITLSEQDIDKGRFILVKDESLNANTNNITIAPDGGKTIDGAASFVMDTDGQSTFIYPDGSNWFVSTLSTSSISIFGTSEFGFRWPHIIGTDQDFIPGGTDLGQGSDFTVTGIEGYFDVAPTTSLTLRLMNGSSDGTPQNITVTSNYFASFGLSKAITSATPPGAGGGLFARLNGGADDAEALMWARVTFTVP